MSTPAPLTPWSARTPSRILIATDLSPASLQACRYGAALAKRLGARVDMVYVDVVGASGFHDAEALAEYVEQVQKVALGRFGAMVRAVRALGLEVEAHTRYGTPVDELLDVANAASDGLLVIARRSKALLERWLMGSTTRRLARRSPIPVLVVDGLPDDAPWPKTAEGELNLPIDTLRFDRLMVTTDFSVDSVRGVAATVALARRLEARVKVLHVMLTPALIGAFPGDANITVPGDLWERLRRMYEGELTGTLGVLEEETESEVRVDSDVSHGVLTAAEAWDADLIVAPSHGKGGLAATLLGSTTERLMERSHRPVLLLPRAWSRPADEPQEEGAIEAFARGLVSPTVA